MKEFIVQIVECDLAVTGYRLRSNILWLCGLLRRHDIRFRKLKIEFMATTYRNYWDEAWDFAKIEDPAEPDLSNDFNWELPNVNNIAYEKWFPSAFAYMIVPLALLPVADQCSVEIPAAFMDKQHILGLAKWYEERIDGTYAFDDTWCLQNDEDEFEYRLKHVDGPLRECEYDVCVEYFRQITGAFTAMKGGRARKSALDDDWYVAMEKTALQHPPLHR